MWTTRVACPRRARAAGPATAMLTGVRRSLRAKVVIVVLLTTFAALAVSAGALLVYEIRNYSAFLLEDAQTQAELLARHHGSRAPIRRSGHRAHESGALEQRQEINAAAVYSANGELFASYARTPDSRVSTARPTGHDDRRAHADGFQPVVLNDEVWGTVYLRSSYVIGDRVRGYVFILGSVMLTSLLVAALISLWLAGGITDPLQAVTDVARRVIEQRNFTLRARRTTDDEIGVFVDAFNAMLGEVGQRAQELEDSNRALQQETEERRAGRGRAAARRPTQGRVPRHARSRAAQPARADGQLDGAARDAAPPIRPTIKRAQGIVRRQLEQMVRLVDDLLDVSRITSGKLVIRKQAVELATVVQNAVDTARPVLDERRQTLEVDLPQAPIHLYADAVRLSQVFSNLLNNAAKYSEPGKHIALRAAASGDQVGVRIEDHGVGIAPHALATIFEMFTQVDAAAPTQSGLGVGLALARSLVELHDGTIAAESRGPGRGSTFTVTLPTTAAAAAAEVAASGAGTAHAANGSPGSCSSTTTSTSRRACRSCCAAWATRSAVAHDASEALVAARELEPEMGFLDLGLPDISGYELAGALRAQPESAKTVLVAVSGWGQPRDRERSREAGFVLHLVKPVEIKSIESAIATLVKRALNYG